jgi:pimeloyl-ACP methyl ester carboxylesterase
MKQKMDYHGKSVYYKVQGSGIPVVLLHGYLESMDIWDGFASDLARFVQVITMDLPGHGRSDVLGEVHRMEDMADVVKKVIEVVVPGERVLLTGHSLGGYVTLAFAEKYPELLSAFCLFHSHPLADTEEVKQNRMREIALVEGGKKELIYQVNIPKAFAEENVEKFGEEVLRATHIAKHTPDAGISAMLRGMMLRPDRRELLEKAALPVLWILGKGDRYIPYGKMTATIHPSTRVNIRTLQYSGHMGFIEEKEKSLQIFTGFADRLRHAAP